MGISFEMKLEGLSCLGGDVSISVHFVGEDVLAWC